MPTVSIKGSDKTFEVKLGDIIYDSLSDQGYELPHGCLSGSCGACRIEVTEGVQNLESAGAIETNTVDCLKDEFNQKFGDTFTEGMTIRLACRAKVKGDVQIKPIR